MEVPRIPLSMNRQSERDFDAYINQAPVVDSVDQYAAAKELAIVDTGVNLIQRLFSTNELENTGVAKISPEEANKRFPDMPTPFREDVNPYVAQLQYDKIQRKMELERKVSQGPQDSWSKTKVIGAGLIAHALDPLEFGAGAFIGWGVGGLAARGAFGTRIAATAARVGAGEASVLTRTSFNIAEQGVGNFAQNIGQEALQARAQAKEGIPDLRSNDDILTDIAFNTFAATALGVGVKEGAFQLKGIKRMLRSTSPEADLAIARATIGNVENDIRPDIQPMLKTLAQETSVNPKHFGENPYVFEKGIEGKKLYVATRTAGPDIGSANTVPLGDDFGMGVHVSDNPGVANAAAARSMSDSVGAVHEVDVGKLNAIDLDVKPDPVLAEPLGAVLKAMGEDPSLTESMSTKDILKMIQNAVDSEHLPEDTMQTIKQSFQERGYNAMTSDSRSHMGFEHEPHNHVTILDEALLSKKSSFEPTPGMTNAPDSKLAADVAARQNDFRSNTLVDGDKYDSIMKELQEIQEPATTSNAAKAEIQNIVDDISDLDRQGHLSAAEVKELENIKQAVMDLEIRHTLVKAAVNCVGA